MEEIVRREKAFLAVDLRFDGHGEIRLPREMMEAELVLAPGCRGAVLEPAVELDRPGIEEWRPVKPRIGQGRRHFVEAPHLIFIPFRQIVYAIVMIVVRMAEHN